MSWLLGGSTAAAPANQKMQMAVRHLGSGEHLLRVLALLQHEVPMLVGALWLPVLIECFDDRLEPSCVLEVSEDHVPIGIVGVLG